MTTVKQIEAGQAVYSPFVLSFYDWLVLGLSNHFLWRCPTRELRLLYDRNVTPRHLDIGVGTGYFLDHARWRIPNPSITLLDLNTNCLETAARRIRRFAPRMVRANVLEPLPLAEKFESVGLCYILHCLPGTMDEKDAVFDHLLPVLAPGARLFGATILQGGLPRSRAAEALMNAYNRKGIFSNAKDTAESLEAALQKRFANVRIVIRGTVALFEANANLR
jgi:SAM-dependent methyltransferase